jgi:hypothetical protein
MMSDAGPELLGPVVIGGLGGSGTRLVAELLQEVGVYMGADVNYASDNLWFGLLLIRPQWESLPPEQFDQPFYRALGVFDQAMTGRLKPDRAEKKIIRDAVSRGKASTSPVTRSDMWFDNRLRSLRQSRVSFPLDTKRWGWKVPGNYYYLPYLEQYYRTRLQYVHVIRHGLYMARSQNQGQFKKWGDELGIKPEHAGSDASASLDFWITANRLAISHAQAMPADRFYLLNYDHLCSHPREGVRQFLDFLQIDTSPSTVDKLVAMPQPKESRFSREDLRSFTSAQLESVRELGFDVVES